MTRTVRAMIVGGLLLLAPLQLAACGSGDSGSSSVASTAAASSSATSTATAPAAEGFDMTFSGGFSLHASTAQALKDGQAPSGLVGQDQTFGACGGPQPQSADVPGGYEVRVFLFGFNGNHGVVLLATKAYATSGTFPVTDSHIHVLLPNGDLVGTAGSLTIKDAKSGTVDGTFTGALGTVHLTGSWTCP